MKTFTKIITLLAFWLAVVPGLAGLAVMTLWNAILPAATGASLIGYWQAVGLFALGGILSWGFGVALLLIAGSCHAMFHRGMSRRRHHHGRWQAMSDEERRKMMERMINRFGR